MMNCRPMRRPPSAISKSPFPIPIIPHSDGWPHVLAGGGIGFLLSVPLGMLSAAPPSAGGRACLGLPLAAATVAVLLGWIREGRMPGWLPAVGVVVLLVDLLAAGGIGLPGVAGTFWLLLCLGLSEASGSRTCRGWGSLGGTGRGDCLGRGLLRHGLQSRAQLSGPLAVVRADGETRAVEQLEGGRGRRSALGRALAAVGRRLVRCLAADAEPSRSSSGSSRQTPTSCGLAPNSAPDWLASGDWYLAGRLEDRPARKEACARRAGQGGGGVSRRPWSCIPNNALYRAKLAEAYRAAGERRRSGGRRRPPYGWTSSPPTPTRSSRPTCAAASCTACNRRADAMQSWAVTPARPNAALALRGVGRPNPIE